MSEPDEDLETEVDRLYFVYRPDSTLPLLAGWRDEKAALRYAKSYGAALILGVDVTYVAVVPFEVPED